VQGVFDYSLIDFSKCTSDGKHTGEKKGMLFPRNMHSISSTQNYIVLTLNSAVFSFCSLSLPVPANATIFTPTHNWPFEYDQESPIYVIVFDKRTKQFTTILGTDVEMITHQINAYEIKNNQIVADMITFDHDIYYSIYVEKLLGPNAVQATTGMAVRKTIDLDKKTVTSSPLLPNPISLEFPQFNRNFEGKQYKYGYVVKYPFMAGSEIIKIDVDDPSGKNNSAFKPKTEKVSLSEPYFVQKPGTTGEEDGVLVFRGLDMTVNKSRIYVVDAKTMKQVGEILVPTLVPLGLHERFYQKESLGIKSSAGSGIFHNI